MDKKITLQFLLLTFTITILVGTFLFVFSLQGLKITWTDIRLFPILSLYALSPAIASFIVLKKNGEVTGLKEWLKNIFYVKSSISHYLFIVFMLSLLVLMWIFSFGFPEVASFYMFFLYIPVMLIGGGMEETGWRYVLQPQLEKKFGYIIAAVITGLIWSVWHLPMFFMPGTDQAGTDLIGFFLGCIFTSFIYGTIVRIAGKAGVFLCILYHTMNNVLNNALSFPQIETAILPVYIAYPTFFSLMVLISAIVIIVHKYKAKSQKV